MIYAFLLFLLCCAHIFVSHGIEEQEIVIVVPSYNTREWADHNLSSILLQDYTNYTVLYYVDCSTDGSYEYIKQLLDLYDKDHKVTLIFNQIRRGALANHWDAVHRCKDRVIIVHLDGDDWFVHKDVLKRVNEEYASPNVWVTYGQYMEYPGNTLGHCRPVSSAIVEKNVWRYLQLPLPTTHLRTFRASLFKAIPLQDLIDRGAFFPTSGDIAFFWPILEMAGKHVRFISDILYVYNNANELNDYKIRFQQQMYYFNVIRNKKPFKPLDVLPELREQEQGADLLVFSYNRPLQLYGFLESLVEYVTDLESITVLFRADAQYAEAYTEVKKDFPDVIFVEQSRTSAYRDFKNHTLKIIERGKSDYIIFAVDDILVKDTVHIKECIAALQKTHAYGFYLRLGNHVDYCYMVHQPQAIPPLIPISADIVAWQFKDGAHDWRYPNTVDMTVYKKETVIEALRSLSYTNPSNLEGNWFIPEYVDYEKVGLCYSTSKIINIPLNAVQTERNNAHMHVGTEYLLKLFNDGYKIDRRSLHAIKNRSPHMEYEVTYTVR